MYKKKSSTIIILHRCEYSSSRRVRRFNKIVLKEFDYTIIALLIVNFVLYS